MLDTIASNLNQDAIYVGSSIAVDVQLVPTANLTIDVRFVQSLDMGHTIVEKHKDSWTIVHHQKIGKGSRQILVKLLTEMIDFIILDRRGKVRQSEKQN